MASYSATLLVALKCNCRTYLSQSPFDGDEHDVIPASLCVIYRPIEIHCLVYEVNDCGDCLGFGPFGHKVGQNFQLIVMLGTYAILYTMSSSSQFVILPVASLLLKTSV